MSYILDALRRSQAERERGQVPGLDAQPAVGSPAPAARRPGVALWAGVSAGLGIGLLAALLAFLSMQSPAPAVAIATPAQPAPPAPATPSPTPDPPPTVEPTPAAAPLPVVVSAPPPAPAPTPVRVVAAPLAAPAASGADPAPVPLAQLAPAQRRELPALAVGGVIWSESAASRFVIIDGQVVREGGSVAPGLTLERIERNAAILRWRGMRLRLAL